MDLHTIQASARDQAGKGDARKLRRGGHIPAVAYGAGKAGQALSLDPKQIEMLRRSNLGWNQPVSIEVEGGESVPLALLKEVQKHPISGRLLHVDFLCIEKGGKVVVRVPVRVVGKAAGTEIGGKLNQPVRELQLRCAPDVIPEAIVVDVTPMQIGDKIALSDLNLSADLESLAGTNLTLVTVAGRRGGATENAGLSGDDAAEADGDEAAEGAEEGGDE